MTRLVFSIIAFLLSVLFASTGVYAWHTAGSEMRYKCLGKDPQKPENNLYEVTLVFWRDCGANGPNVAGMDPQITVFFFEREPVIKYANPMTQNVKLTKHILKVTDLASAMACVRVPPNICLELGEYTFQKSFPRAKKGGFYIGWQRCCRNASIKNIVDPAKIGITYLAAVPGAEVADCNNSAYFNKPPISFVCLGKEFTYDFSATDPDGDSLVYKMVDPLSGVDKNGTGVTDGNGATEVNIGNKMGIPPIVPVKFKPGYSAQNIFGDGGYMKIDSQTGMLSFLPPQEGLHVFAVVVEEWRNKKLISTNIRDFQTWVIKCEAQTLPIEISPKFDSLNFNVSNDTLFVEEDQDFSFELKVETPGDDKIRFNYLPTGLLADPKYFTYEVKGTNPMILKIKGKISCDQPENLAKLRLIAEDANECIIKFFKEKIIYVKILPIKVELPVIRVDFLKNKVEKENIIIAESGQEVCFKATITNAKKDLSMLSYEVYSPNIKPGADLKIIENKQNDIINLDLCWKIDCDYIQTPLMIIIKGIRKNKCNKDTYVYDTVFIKITPPANPPAKLTVDGLNLFKQDQGYYLIGKDQNFCFITKLEDIQPYGTLSYKVNVKYEDGTSYKGVAPSIDIIENRSGYLEAKICWTVTCDNIMKPFILTITGEDSLFCSTPNSTSESIKVKFEGGRQRPIKISYDYLSQKTSSIGDTIYFSVGNDNCIDIIVDDKFNQGDLSLSVNGEPMSGRTKNMATYNPKTGSIEMRSHFCWIPLCEELDKVYTMDVQAESKPPCDLIINTPSKFIIKVVAPINNVPEVVFDTYEDKKLKPGTQYCFKATVSDKDISDVLKAFESGEVFSNNYGDGSQATVTFSGSNPIEANICFTPNCNISGEKYPITICGKDETCVPTQPICQTIELTIDECVIAFPNIFTPNNDGVNDLFLPADIAGIDKYEIKIYDRWGNLVYESQTFEGWNGLTRIGNNPASEGQYFFTVDFQFFSGSRLMKGKRTSSFTLIR